MRTVDRARGVVGHRGAGGLDQVQQKLRGRLDVNGTSDQPGSFRHHGKNVVDVAAQIVMEGQDETRALCCLPRCVASRTSAVISQLPP